MTWDRKPSEATAEINLAFAMETQRLGNDVFNRIEFSSPVREGPYRANQNASEGSPDYSFDKNKTSRTMSPFSNIKPFTNLYIAAGHGGYQEELEKGHSQQAPNGVYGPAYTFFRGLV